MMVTGVIGCQWNIHVYFPAGIYLVPPRGLIGSLPPWISQSLTSFWMGTGACLTPPPAASAALLNGQWYCLTARPVRAASLRHRLVSDSGNRVSLWCGGWIGPYCMWIYGFMRSIMCNSECVSICLRSVEQDMEALPIPTVPSWMCSVLPPFW